MSLIDLPAGGLFSDFEIRRAIAHHRRAIQALRDKRSFSGIDPTVADRILTRLETDLRALHDELGRRRMQGPTTVPSARDEQTTDPAR